MPAWRTADPELLFHRWPDESEVVAFSPAAGSIHLLTPSAVLLLQELSNRSLTTDEIAHFIRTRLDVAAPDVNPPAVDTLLDRLRDAELIEAVTT